VYAADGLGRANWSFDFAWSLGLTCIQCTVELLVDKDPTSGVNLVILFTSLPGARPVYESWNMEMGFMNVAVYDFDPFSASNTQLSLRVFNSAGEVVTSSDIAVNVPEPGSIALLGVGLLGAGAMLRHRKKV
jgi:hypothetical protein